MISAVATRLRDIARSGQDLGLGEVRRDDGSESGLNQFPNSVLLQRQFQQDRVVAEKVEAVAGHASAAFKVNHVERFAELDVVLRWEVERARFMSAASDF